MKASRALLLLLVIGGAIWIWTERGSLGLPIATSCTVAQAGTAASVSVDGVGAFGWCAQQARDPQWYTTEARPADVLICRYPINALTFTVRDRGTLYLVGSQLCAEFKTRYESQSPPPR